MQKKALKIVLVLALCFLLGGMLVSCGMQGSRGEAGADGLTPSIGENGNWWIGDKDTGVAAQGPKGEDGRGIVSVVLIENATKVRITYTDGTTEELDITEYEEPCTCENTTEEELEPHTCRVVDGQFVVSPGKYRVVCDDCGKESIVDKTVHVFVDSTVPPTCTEEGYDVMLCDDCGYFEAIEGTETDALDHAFFDWTPVVDEDRNVCEDGYYEVRTCGRDGCGASESHFYPPEGHSVTTWSKNASPTMTAMGSLQGTCSVCRELQILRIPAFNTTDYTYEQKQICTSNGEATWTYTAENGQSFAYNVSVAAKSYHTVGGVLENALRKVEYEGEYAFVYGQSGLRVLDVAGAPTCKQIVNGYYECDLCGQHISVKIIGDHAWGAESVTNATCTSGTVAVRVCTVCGEEDRTVADDRLPHNYSYSLTMIVDTGRFIFTADCPTCTAMDSQRDVTDAVYEDPDFYVEPTCASFGNRRYVYDYASGQSVYYDHTLEKAEEHVFRVGGSAVLPDYLSSAGIHAYSSAYIGQGLFVLDRPDQVTPGNIYDGYFVCACGSTISVKIYKP